MEYGGPNIKDACAHIEDTIPYLFNVKQGCSPYRGNLLRID